MFECFTYQSLHDARKAPEGIHFILHDDQDRRQEVTHSLHIA